MAQLKPLSHLGTLVQMKPLTLGLPEALWVHDEPLPLPISGIGLLPEPEWNYLNTRKARSAPRAGRRRSGLSRNRGKVPDKVFSSPRSGRAKDYVENISQQVFAKGLFLFLEQEFRLSAARGSLVIEQDPSQ